MGQRVEEDTLPLLLLKQLLESAYVSPRSLTFVHEIGDNDTQITEQAWMDVGAGRRGVVAKSYRAHTFAPAHQPLRAVALQAQMLKPLYHRHLVPVLGMGCYKWDTWEDVCSSVFAVEEYAGPMTAAKLIKAVQKNAHDLINYTYADALKWVEQVAQALAYLHEAGVSHGDVSCRNIFFTSPEVHETDVRLGDLKPHRHAYLAQSVLLTRWSKGGAGPSTREGSTSLARAQHSVREFNRLSSASNQQGPGSRENVATPSSPLELSSTSVVLLTSAEEHPTAHPLRDAVPPVIDGLPHHALTTTSYHRPAPRKTGSDSNLVHRTAPARQLPRSNLGRFQCTSEGGAGATSLQLGQDGNVSTNLIKLLDQAAQDHPRLARASFTAGVGATVRMGLPPLPSLHEEVERGAGMPRVGSASHLPACAPDAITPSAGAGGGQGRLPWGPHSPRPSTQAWQDGPPRLSRSKGGAGGGGPEGGAQAAAAARPQLGAMGSGFFMAMSGTALARAAKAQRGAVGGEAAAAGGSRGGSPFTAGWGPAAGGMASVAHLPKEPSSPRGASPQCGLQLAPRTQSERLARGSSGLVQDFSELWHSMVPNAANRAQLAALLKDELDRTMRGGNNFGTSAQDAPPVRRPPKKNVSFAASLPQGKMAARDMAVVYMAPEILATAGTATKAEPTPESDTFALAKVLYQLLWRTLLEPQGNTVDEKYEAIFAYARSTTEGYREQLPGHWPPRLCSIIEQCWAQNPHARPTMRAVAKQLAELRADPAFRKELSNADTYHILTIGLGKRPDDVVLDKVAQAQSGCTCTIS